MNGLDITILTLITVSVLIGLYRGLVREVFSLMGLLFGFLAAAWYYHVPATFLERWVSPGTMTGFLGFVLTFIGVSLAIGLIGTLFRRLLKLAHLDLEDRLLGGVFGFIKGLFVVTVLAIALVAFMPPAHQFIAQSKTLPYFLQLAALVKESVPDELKDTLEEKKKALFDYWKEQKAVPKET